MSSTAVAELETALQGMLALKPPGVSGSRVESITALCVANVQYESVLIQKIYTHFKKAPNTHKLGVLYVVDLVARKWMDQAKTRGQTINSSAEDGTFAAGVHRMTELMPVLMNDFFATAPQDHKERSKKLVEIWEKGQTFPAAMVQSFKDKLSANQQPNPSTTPPGSPPANPLAALNASRNAAPPAPPASAPAIPNIMEALANIARQNANATTQPSAMPPAPSAPFGAPSFINNPPPQQQTLAQASGSVPPSNQPFPLPNTQFPGQPAMAAPAGMPFAMPPAQPPQLPFGIPPPAVNTQPPAFPPGAPAPPPATVPGPGPGPGSADPQLQQQLVLLQTMLAQGIPLDKITAILSQVGGGSAAPAPAPPQAPPQMPPPIHGGFVPPTAAPSWQPPNPADAREHQKNGYGDRPRSPRGRSRSRSPSRQWGARDSPRSRNDRGFDYGRNSPGRNRGGDDRDREHGRNAEYRQRSPQGRRSPPDHGKKWVEYDNSIPKGCIKVLSRTLFVGGVTCSESELRRIFSAFGQVQTCIVNKDKRHAFVKMYFRQDAVKAKDGMEDVRHGDLQLRTRWGVGFGPRDCSDYSTGISIIPIQKLTEADRKWMLTAEYGGSGGKPIESGMCVEEPDIEIGAGVSSKAISRRMQTDKGGHHGPKSTGAHGNDEFRAGGGGGGSGVNASAVGNNRWRRGHNGKDSRDERRDDDRRLQGNGGGEQTSSGDFPFGLVAGPNGMPVFPPGFTFPAPGT